MEILFEEKKEPPKMLVELIEGTIAGKIPKDKESRPFELETTAFVINALKDGMLAGLNRKEKAIVIDLGNCLVNQNFMKQGLMWIPSVWFNMLFGFYHELSHMMQIEEDPKLMEKKKPTKKMEKEADNFAINCIKDWTENKDNKIPVLNEMGWIGRQIKKAINLYYPKPLFDTILSEIKPYELGAVGRLNTMAAYQKAIEEELADLTTDEGFGIVVDDVKYITAKEFFEITYNDV